MSDGARRSKLPAAVLLTAGLAVSVYLLVRTFALLDGRGSIDVCSTVFGASCDGTLSDSWFVFGLPLAGWGVTYFGTLAALLLLGWGIGATFEREATAGAFLLSLVGAALSVLFGAMMLTGPVPACPLCLVVHAVNLLLVAAIWRVGRLSLRGVLGAAGAGVRYALGGKVAAPDRAAWKAVGFGTCLLVGVVLYQWTLVEISARRGGPLPDPAQLIADFDSGTAHEIPPDAAAPRLGPADAPARLVVFSSFECPGCRTIAPLLRGLADRTGDRLTIEFRHFPLGTACNAHVGADRHPHACDAAWASAAAARQGRFWEFHDELFAEGADLSDAGLAAAARRAGLDAGRFATDRAGEEVRARVRADTDLAARLDVDGTPTIFLNGRHIEDPSALTLELLVHHVLSGSGR